jgi:integrase
LIRWRCADPLSLQRLPETNPRLKHSACNFSNAKDRIRSISNLPLARQSAVPSCRALALKDDLWALRNTSQKGSEVAGGLFVRNVNRLLAIRPFWPSFPWVSVLASASPGRRSRHLKISISTRQHKAKRAPLAKSEDWVFANPETGKPYWPGRIQENWLVPAAEKAGIGRIGWHTFRHSHSTLLHALGVDLKVQQELLRHADIRTTMNIYTQAVPTALREANSKVVRLVLPAQVA